MDISRRQFAQIAGSLATTQLPIRGAATLTAQTVVERVQSALGGEWPANGPDGFKAGDPGTQVKGIATTAMATMDVLQKAAKAGTNLIFTYEPTFFSRQEGPPVAPPAPPPNATPPAAGAPPAGRGPGRGGPAVAADDPVLMAKKAFIEKNGLVVFRLRDHWQSRKEGDMTLGLAETLGWTKYRVKPDDVIYDVPSTTTEKVVALLREKLNIRGGLRAVGDRTSPVKRMMLYPGSMTPAIMWQRYSEIDVMIAGEVREWENTHYAADMFTAGEQRGLVTVGRIVSEDPGMRVCATWMKTIVKEVPAQWISAGDLYWRAV